MTILAWIVWGVFVYWSLACLRIIFGLNSLGVRGLHYVLERNIPKLLTLVDGLAGVVIALVFILFDLNKLHILWVWPVMVVSIIILGGTFFKIGLLKGTLDHYPKAL